MVLSAAFRRSLGLAMAGALVAGSASSAHAGTPAPRLFKERWIDGALPQEPLAQVQALDEDTFVIRQSIKTNFEAPFLYLIFGRDKALLIDTGAQGGQLRPVVDRLVTAWLAAKRRSDIPLVVAHSHSHGDHVAGDGAFQDRPETVVVGLKAADVAEFFGVANWPDGIATFDLGGRALSIIPTPGHQKAAIAVYDPRLQILLSGDTIYPGRLYVPVNFLAEERASIDRLAAFAARHRIRALLGAHIEMTVEPGRDYAQEVLEHPAEHVLEMPVETIGALQDGLKSNLDVPEQPQVHDHFIVYPVAARTD
ncbi:MBL fold metallo-hydrolase [Novosphingobium sp. KN65.2]|uniref:MBL fold metallo-hydrolase n=1 Tax=Novosphingobium sp. KN65.2 TaxID=1478134 RepID=UPI0005DD62A1|nr:MBL fold metallo-hydrolase [Novosphingobium sp. KN65.2]CDO35134.1 Beta-lactamase-like protein [Novosphingobium sp. KN65.2]